MPEYECLAKNKLMPPVEKLRLGVKADAVGDLGDRANETPRGIPCCRSDRDFNSLMSMK
jgi:hypothetical protein